MTRWLQRARSVQVSAAALALGVLIAGGTTWRATHETLPVTSGSDPVGFPAAASPAPPPGYGPDRLMVAVGKDPFHPERRRPARRFQLPADQAALAAQRLENESTVASLRLIGTAVSGNGGGFAMCAWQGGAPRIVRIGDHLGSWMLTKVTPGAAEFTTPAGNVVVHVPKPGT